MPVALLVDDVVIPLRSCDGDSADRTLVTALTAETAVVIGDFAEVVTRALYDGALVCAESLEWLLVFDKLVTTWMLDDADVIPATLVNCIVVEVTRALVIGDGSVFPELLEFGVFDDPGEVTDPFIMGV